MRKSRKPSDCDESSGLYHLVGDFISEEDHLFIDLMINHRRSSSMIGRFHMRSPQG